MKAIFTRCAFLTMAAASLTGCPGFGSEEPVGLFDEVPEFPNHAEHIAPLMVTYCLECHSDTPRLGAPATFRLDVLEDEGGKQGLLSRADLSIVRINNASNPMPPNTRTQMNEIEKATMARWSACGKPADLAAAQADCPPLDGEPEPEPDQPPALTFDGAIKPIVTRSCNFPGSCHGGDNPQGGVSFESLDRMTEALNPATFVPCDPGASTLVERLKLGDGDPLLMPQGGPKLAQDEIDLIERWVAEGDDVKPLCMEPALCGDFDTCRNTECDEPNDTACFIQCAQGNTECAECVGFGMARCARNFCDSENITDALTCFEDCMPTADPLQCFQDSCEDRLQEIEDCMNPIIRNRNCNTELVECGVRVMFEQ